MLTIPLHTAVCRACMGRYKWACKGRWAYKTCRRKRRGKDRVAGRGNTMVDVCIASDVGKT